MLHFIVEFLLGGSAPQFAKVRYQLLFLGIESQLSDAFDIGLHKVKVITVNSSTRKHIGKPLRERASSKSSNTPLGDINFLVSLCIV